MEHTEAEEILSNQLRQDNSRLKNIMNAIIPICFAAHIGYVVLFYILGVKSMLQFNLFVSLPVFALAYFLNFKKLETLSLSLTHLEISLHTALSIYFVGWDAGFQFLFIAGSVIVFLVYTWNIVAKVAISILYTSEYLFFFLYFKNHLVYSIDQNVLTTLYIINFLVIICGIGYAVAHYVILAFSAEAKVKKANENILAQKELIEKQRDESLKMNVELSLKNDEIGQQRDQISKQHQDITASITYASRIQQAVLPPPEILRQTLPQFMILFKPRDIVSGDFYWCRQIGHCIYVVAADCTGHGVPGAFMSMLGVSQLNEIVSSNILMPPNEILNELRIRIKKSLHQNNQKNQTQDGMDIACCLIDLEQQKLQFAGANNPLYLVRRSSDSNTPVLIETKADRMPIGVHPKDEVGFTNHEIKLEKDDTIYIFSDGYTSQFGSPKDERFKSKRFQDVLIQLNDKDMEFQRQELDRIFMEWKGTRNQIDDILVIGIRFKYFFSNSDLQTK